MTKHEAPPRQSFPTRGRVQPQHWRSPPKAVKLILPVWGYSYVRNFLEMSLQTLLAPGNVPALAAALPTEFVLLTSLDDEPYIRENAAIKRLASICKVDIRPIDHLITDGNYSTTITLAYTEAVRAVGDAMIDTCFFFLVSDYIVADGSLANALKRMMTGASGVVVGNFQVTLEDALPWLEEKLLFAKNSLTLQPREMMEWGLNHLHPQVLANIVNIPFSHNSHTNRLFWRVDAGTLVGRFYLMHMLCIRPELTDFAIGSSCDYSFVPEMCPSGNVDVITDSDQYLVIEMHARDHEAAFLRAGPLKPRDLAKSLNEWATVVHRANAHNSVVFHADEIPADIGRTTTQADRFVSRVARYLKRKPRPYRGHPYWRGAMAAFYEATGRKLSKEDWRFALGLAGNESWLSQWVFWRAKYVLMGRPPQVLPWHPSWPDYRTVLKEINSFFTDTSTRMLMLSNEPTAFSVGLADSGERVIRLRCGPFLQSMYQRYEPLFGKFDLCLLELSEADMAKGDELMDRIIPLMKGGGRIIVFVVNRRDLATAKEFATSISYHGSKFVRGGAVPTEQQYVPASRYRWKISQRLAALRKMSSENPAGLPIAVAGGGMMLGLSLIGNIDVLRRKRKIPSPNLIASSFVMTVTVDKNHLDKLRSSSLLEIARKVKARRRLLASQGIALRSPTADQTREPQYDRCVDLKNKFGLTSLGLMTNQVWHDDPRRLTFLLARYKFVAKMLSGRNNAGEVGCGDAFGTRVVLQEVPEVTVYDFDKTFIEDVRARYDERWPLKALVHDIVLAPLPRKHDGLFSLDVLEHIVPSDEHAYLANLRGSLEPEGVLIIGTPSLESQAYASPLSKDGHINCKSGKELKALLENYFTRVFLFSMNDEVVHTGFSPLAHYLFVMCTGPK